MCIRDSTFVVTNNDGGGIFRRLPIARHDPPFTDLFLTPHGLTFSHAAALYGLSYTAVHDSLGPVSYTHLDVYKRQRFYWAEPGDGLVLAGAGVAAHLVAAPVLPHDAVERLSLIHI